MHSDDDVQAAAASTKVRYDEDLIVLAGTSMGVARKLGVPFELDVTAASTGEEALEFLEQGDVFLLGHRRHGGIERQIGNLIASLVVPVGGASVWPLRRT